MAKQASTIEVVGRYHVSPPPNSVKPEQASCTLPLTFFDIPWLFFSPAQPLFFYQYPYPSTSHFLSTTLPTLTHSLSLALQRFFAFAGTLVWPPAHEYDDDVHPSPTPTPTPLIAYTQGNFVSFVVAESNGDFSHLSGNHPRCVNEFHPLVPELDPTSLLAIQVTLFPDSGISIGFAYHRVVADGRTFNSFIKTWASLFRHNNLGDPSSLVNTPLTLSCYYDRAVIKDTHGLLSVFLDYWSNSKKTSPRAVNSFPDNMVRATFVMCPNDMEKVKQWIIARCKLKNKPQPPRLSPSNITCAFVWVCLAKAHEKVNGRLSGNNPSYFGFNAGGVTRLDFPVPATYFGNCIAFARTMAIQKELCGEEGIVVAANVIGNKVEALDGDVLEGAENWISDWEVFYGSEPHVMVAGSPKLDFYETDFGWGRPNKIEEISIDYVNAISFTESRQVRGGIEVGLALSRAKMDAFNSFAQGLQLIN